MSTPFKSEWLQPGAIVPVDIPTLAAFAEELRRVNQENQALRQALETKQELCEEMLRELYVYRASEYLRDVTAAIRARSKQ